MLNKLRCWIGKIFKPWRIQFVGQNVYANYAANSDLDLSKSFKENLTRPKGRGE